MSRSSALFCCVWLLFCLVPCAADEPPGRSPYKPRFGAATVDASQYGSLQAAIDALPRTGGTVYLPAGNYALNRPLNLRGRRCVRLLGDGNGKMNTDKGTRLVGYLPVTGAADWPLIDLTGAFGCVLENLSIESLSTGVGTPAAAILLARDVDGASAGQHTFERVNIFGRFSSACVVNVGSEVNDWVRCTFLNIQPAAGAYVTGSWNQWGVRSPYGDMAGNAGAPGNGGAVSNVHQRFDRCLFNIPYAGKPDYRDNYAIAIGARTWFYIFRDCLFTAKTDDPSDAAHTSDTIFRIGDEGMSAAYSDGGPRVANDVVHVTISGAYCETGGARHFIRVAGRGDVRQLHIDGGRLQSAESLIRIDEGRLLGASLTRSSLEAGLATYTDWGIEGRRPIVLIAPGAQADLDRFEFTRADNQASTVTADVAGEGP